MDPVTQRILLDLFIAGSYFAAAPAPGLLVWLFWHHTPPILERRLAIAAASLCALFLVGCGIDHIEMAYHAASPGSEHEAVFQKWMQAIGAPGAVFATWLIYIRTKGRVEGT